jgi:hypothetical protein
MVFGLSRPAVPPSDLIIHFIQKFAHRDQRQRQSARTPSVLCARTSLINSQQWLQILQKQERERVLHIVSQTNVSCIPCLP